MTSLVALTFLFLCVGHWWGGREREEFRGGMYGGKGESELQQQIPDPIRKRTAPISNTHFIPLCPASPLWVRRATALISKHQAASFTEHSLVKLCLSSWGRSSQHKMKAVSGEWVWAEWSSGSSLMFQHVHSYSSPALEAVSPNPSQFLFSRPWFSLFPFSIRSTNKVLKSVLLLSLKLLTSAAFPNYGMDDIEAT